MNTAVLGIAAALLWGLHDFLARFATQSVGVRIAVAGVTLTGLGWNSALLWGAGSSLPLDGAVWASPELLMPVISGSMLVLATIVFFAALARAPFARVAPIAAAFPVVVVLIAVLGGERPSAVDWLTMLVVIVGVIIVARSSGEVPGDSTAPGVSLHSGRDLRTFALALGACFAFGGAVSAGHASAAAFGELEGAWLARLFGVVSLPVLLLVPAGAGKLITAGASSRLPRRWAAVLVGMGALDAGAMTAVVSAGALPNAELAAVTSAGFGAVSVLIAAVVLRERVAALQWLGIAMLVAGSATLAS